MDCATKLCFVTAEIETKTQQFRHSLSLNSGEFKIQRKIQNSDSELKN
jgi:hypothetical protein